MLAEHCNSAEHRQRDEAAMRSPTDANMKADYTCLRRWQDEELKRDDPEAYRRMMDKRRSGEASSTRRPDNHAGDHAADR